MNHIKPIIKSALWLLPLLCALPFISCSFEDDLDMCTSGNATLQVTVSAREEGDLNSRATYETGTTSEFMHDLCVLFVNTDNKVVLKLKPDLTNNTAAQTGDLKIWTSEEINLDAGTYTVYAFANINDTYYPSWSNTIANLQEESELKAEIINGIILENPAGKIDFTNSQYIPMSAKIEQLSVTKGTRSISIGLDRLVSKVRATVLGEKGIKVSQFTFSGYADKVSLLAGTELPTDTKYDLKHTANLTDNNTLTASGDATKGSLTLPDFYVNETRDGHAFGVTVTTTDGVTYKARTQTQKLPRNYIFPLTLTLNETNIDFEISAWMPPIGIYPVNYTITTEGNYKIDMFSMVYKFTIKPTGLDNTNSTNVSYSWNWNNDMPITLPSGATSPVVTTDNTLSVECNLTSEIGNQYPLSVDAQWDTNNNTYYRTYNIIINVTDDLANTSGATTRVTSTITPEVVYLFLTK